MQKRIGFMKLCGLLIMLFTSIIATTAQELCEELSREIFEDTDDNCAEAENENTCYGFDSISATFFEDVSENFTGPGDLVQMLQLHTLHSSAFDEEAEEWGIGYFRISLTESEDPLVIMATGDVIVENDVEAAENAGVGAMQAFNFTTGGPSACTDAPNAVFIQSPNNVEIDLVVNSTPLRIGSTVVLGTYDENTEDSQPQDDTMWIAVVEGTATLNPESEEEVTVNEGNVSTVILTDQEGDNPDGDNMLNFTLVPVLDPLTGEPILGPNGAPFYRQIPIEEFSEPTPITEDGEGIFSWENYGFIENVPPTLLNYEVDVPTVNDEEPVEEETPTTTIPTVPELPISSVVDTSVVDSALTECGTMNWCNAGEPWGDGRCNDPDPELSQWYWNAGWYNAQLECGAISEIPAEFQGSEQAATAEEVVANSSAFVAAVINCTNMAGSNDFLISIDNIPAGTTFIWVETAGAYTVKPVTPPGPFVSNWGYVYTQLPLTGRVEARIGNTYGDPITGTTSLSGPLQC